MPEGAFSRDLQHNGMMGIDLSRYAVELCVSDRWYRTSKITLVSSWRLFQASVLCLTE